MSGVKFLMRLVVVAVVGLLVAQGEAHENIKMCGRDLIRHAVSFCGNSRLRRAVVKMEMPRLGADPTSSGQAEDTSPGPTPALSGAERRAASGEGEDLVSLMAQLLPLSARQRRTALKISDLCCEKGCSRKDLMQFC